MSTTDSNQNDQPQTQTTPVEAAPTPIVVPEDYTVQQAYEDWLREEAEARDAAKMAAETQVEEKQEEPQPVENDSAEDSSDDSEDDSTADAETDDDDARVPDLDAEIAALSPDLQKRWNQQWKGVLKRERALAQNEELFSGLQTINGALGNKATALDTYRQIGQLLIQEHGFTPEQIGGTPTAQATDEDWESQGFDYESDYNVYRKAVDAAVAKAVEATRAEFAPFMQELNAARQAKADADKRNQEKAFLDKVAPATIKRIAAEDNGWPVTPSMVAEALAAYPQLKHDAAKAVRAHFTDQRAAHIAKVASDRSPAPSHDLIPSATSGGMRIKSPEDFSAFDAYEMEFGSRPK